MEDMRSEFAEAIPFSRASIAHVLEVSPRTLNNWIDRNRLWQTPRRGYYRLGDVFDLAGFAALRVANVPEKDCARYVYNYGFYGGFLHGDQLLHFSYRGKRWDIGIYDPSAIVSLKINMRTMGEGIFRRIGELLSQDVSERGVENLQNFKHLYTKAVELDRLWQGSIPLFDGSAS
jgi:hypothetical protein